METKNSRTAQNGQVKETDTKNGAEKSNLLTSKEETKVIPLSIDRVTERVNKVADLQKLSNQRHTLKETQSNLNAFNLGSDKLRDCLEIEDSDGNTFKTSNSQAIAKVIDVLKSEVSLKIAEVETQILSAAI